MPSVSSKDSTKTTTYPKSHLSIVASLSGLAIFLILASSLLIQHPTVRGYLYIVDIFTKVNSDSSPRSVSDFNDGGDPFKETQKSNSTALSSFVNEVVSLHGDSGPVESGEGDVNGTIMEENQPPESSAKKEVSDSGQVEPKYWRNKHPFSNVRRKEDGIMSPNSSDTSSQKSLQSSSYIAKTEKSLEPFTINIDSSQANAVDSECDLYHGKWIHDSTGLLYTNNSCPVLTQTQNCQGNGRPDKDYENWRWKPSQCDLSRFDAKKFLELMRGKTLAFIGDSVARNQMESMLCILWQAEVPKNIGNKRMQRYYFKSTSTMIVRIWSSWLVHHTPEQFDFAPAGVAKLHLDAPDESFMDYISGFDVVVLSSGHWFTKQSVYILDNEIVGGQLWWPDKSKQQKIDNIEAFGISVETILTAMGAHPNYTGLTIVRTFSPDHYEGGAWNTEGSCTGKERPTSEGELVKNNFTSVMHEKQVKGFNLAIKKKVNKSKMILMDITEAFSYRHDGHPGPYRSPDPNKITKRGPDGRPPPQDCLHWCMPGPVDTWNELVFEIVRKELRDG